jgi:CheY-like chemotaxis protein
MSTGRLGRRLHEVLMLSLLIDVLAAIMGAGRAAGDLRARSARPAAAPASAEPATRLEGPAEGRRLLLHDREGAVLQRAATYFRGLGYTVDVARHAEEGEALLRHQRYDLAIVDVWADEGLALVREIRACDRNTSVIVLGAPLTQELETAARALGAVAVVARTPYLPDLGHLAFSLTGVLRG